MSDSVPSYLFETGSMEMTLPRCCCPEQPLTWTMLPTRVWSQEGAGGPGEEALSTVSEAADDITWNAAATSDI